MGASGSTTFLLSSTYRCHKKNGKSSKGKTDATVINKDLTPPSYITRHSLGRFATSLKLTLLTLYLQNTGQININRTDRLGVILQHDVLKADTNLRKRLKLITHENRHQFALAVENSHTTNVAQCSLVERNMRLFLQILQSGSFRFKTKLRTSLPGKYRNGVVVVFCNFAVLL